MKEFKLNGYEDVTVFIEKEYSKYFVLIYGNHICDGIFQETIEAAREHLKKDNKVMVEGY